MPLSAQEIFNLAAGHLLAQGRRSTAPALVIKGDRKMFYRRFAYRGSDGAKCPIGALIEDAHYSPELEGQAVIREPVMAALRASGVDPEANRDLLLELQDAHDCYTPSRWFEELSEIAQIHGLEMSIEPPENVVDDEIEDELIEDPEPDPPGGDDGPVAA